MIKRVTFLVAIDSYIIRKGIVSILKNISGVWVLLDTDNPDVLKNKFKEEEPDFLLISETLFEKCSQLFSENMSLSDKTILLSQENTPRGNTFATILLGDSKQNIVTQFEVLINPFLTKNSAAYSSVLSNREITILKLVANGLTNKQIAERLFISLHTVTTHRKNIGNKLSIKSASGLTVYAIVNNIISIEDIANSE
jgi:DNA-binding CsgD family transcriptional regulator